MHSFLPPMRAICSAHRNLIDFTILTILGNLYNSHNSSLCDIMNTPLISSFLVPNIFLFTYFRKLVIYVLHYNTFTVTVCNHTRDWPSRLMRIIGQHWAGIAQSLQWLPTGWTAGVLPPMGTEKFSSSLCVQTGSGAHPVSDPMGTGVHSRG